MAVYNGAQYIIPQINSIVKQLEDEDEIIVSDDGSTDNTLELVHSLNDKRIKIYRHHRFNNKYPGGLKIAYYLNRNFEYALNHSTGDYIFLSDQDDIWLDNKIDILKRELDNYDLVLHDCLVVNQNLEVISDSLFKHTKPKMDILNMLYHPSFMGCCMAFNKRLKEHILPFPDDAIEHDTWIGLSAIKHGKILVKEVPLIKWRRHNHNTSPGLKKSKNNLFIKLLRRLIILRNYI